MKKLDLKSILMIVVIGALFLGFAYYNTKEQQRYKAELAAYEQREMERTAQQMQQMRESESMNIGESSDSTALAAAQVARQQSVTLLGEALTEAKIASGSTTKLENSVMSVLFDSRGAQIIGVELKDYTRYAPKGERTELIEMFERANAKLNLSFYIRSGYNNININTTEYNFTSLPVQSVEGGKRLTMVLDMGSGASVEYIYTLYDGEDESRNYLLDFDVKMRGIAPIIASDVLTFDWQNSSFQNEKGFKNENTYTTLAYHLVGESGMKDLGVSEESKQESVSGNIEWVAFKQQFFSSIFLSRGGITKAEVGFATAKPGSGYIKDFKAIMEVPYSNTTESYPFSLYFGPNKYSTLKGANDLGYGELHFEELVPLGWGIIGWVNKFIVIPLFDLLLNVTSSFGFIILVLAIFVKLIISPLTYSSYVSMAKMRIIKPEVDEINKRFSKDDEAMKRQQATMDLYKKAGINPLGGCIPMIIQMPIIIAMFRFFPASIELREQPFLWADDLSSYDSILQLPFDIPFYGDHVSLFALLMTVVMFFYSKMNYEQSASNQPQMAGMKFMMLYIMPVMMLLWFNSYASGLCYYYFLANLLTIAQTLIIRKFTDDDKIHAIMQANASKRKNAKKSKFQQRYDALVAEQERQKAKK